MADAEETAATRRRYDRIAPLYDLMEALVERGLYRGWRGLLWGGVEGGRILEVGTGTGKNISHYPEKAEVHAIDLSGRMLEHARERAERLGSVAYFHRMDAQSMQFAEDSFDAAAATFVFCSVPDPLLGLNEVRRVVKPGGKVHLLEHMRSNSEAIGWIMDIFDPVTLRLLGPHINRRTVENVREAGLILVSLKELDPLGVFRLVRAEVPP